jgi:hypothetical protein
MSVAKAHAAPSQKIAPNTVEQTQASKGSGILLL